MSRNICSLLTAFMYNRFNYKVIYSVYSKLYIQKLSCIFWSRIELCKKLRNSKFERKNWFFKVASATFLLICFVKVGKMFFISLQNLFLFLRILNIRTLGRKISWRHQMPKDKARNKFYWITWEVNGIWQFYVIL